MAIGDPLNLPIYPGAFAGPLAQIPALAKSPNNVTGANLPSAIRPFNQLDYLNALNSILQEQSQARLRQQQGLLTGAQTAEALARGQLVGAQVDLTKQAGQPAPPQYLDNGPAGTIAPASSANTGTPSGASASPDIDSITAGDSPEWRAFAQAVAGPESNGRFNVRYSAEGPKPFSSYAKHPNIAEPSTAGPSTAAGAWQITNSTWNTLPQESRPNFEPSTQYAGFKEIARRDYSQMTGRDLDADLKAGKLDEIANGLRATWPTIDKGLRAYPGLLANYTEAGTKIADNAPGNLPLDTSLNGAGENFQPRFGGTATPTGSGMATAMSAARTGGAPDTVLPPGSNPRTGGVPAGTPGAGAVITPAQASAANASLRASGFQGLPVMPSSYVFGRGLVAPPGAGSVSAPAFGSLAPPAIGGGAGAPAQQAPLVVGGNVIRQGGNLPGSFAPPVATAPPQRQLNPGYVQWLQTQDRINAALGRKNPIQVEEGLRMLPGGSMSPSYLGTAELAKANAQKAAEALYAGQIAQAQQNARVGPEIAIEQGKPRFVPGVGLVIPSQMGGAGLNGGASQAGNPGGAPGVLAPTINPAQEKMLGENIQLANKQREQYQQAGLAARDQVATASAMTDLMGRVRMGWGADTVQQAARILSSLGVSDANVQLFTGTSPSAGDALNKLFLQMSAGAVRQMGAREPGSVISLFSKAYPNLATNPHAAELMANALQMQARFKVDMANAADQWLLDQQKNMGPLGQNYRGLLGFEQAFAQEHSPRAYWRAAAAMSNEPDIAWKGASDADKHQIYALIPPGSVYRAGDGKLYRKAGGE